MLSAPADLRTPSSAEFSNEELARFQRDGFLIVPGLGETGLRERMLNVALDGLHRRIEPIELEAELHYPGAPGSLDLPGGQTIRRLKQAHSRDYAFTQWITQPALVGRLEQLLGPEVVSPLAHHNCIMTKHPAYSSDTGWHQDIRYWSFARPDLVTAWLALGPERPDNGCLQVIPGSHNLPFSRDRFDDDVFFRADLPENEKLIRQAEPVELEPGDVLFFHCRTLHAASRNYTGETKYSVVFTFRAADNPPTPGTRSAASPELLIHSRRT